MNKQFKKRSIELFSFGAVGGVSTILDWSIFTTMFSVVGAHHQISLVIAYFFGATVNYIGNRKLTFKSKEKNIKKQFSIFIGIATTNLILSIFMLEVFVRSEINPILSRMITTAIIFIINYFAHKHITFKK